MLELNPVAVTSADLLRAIDVGGWATRAELAESVGRKSNNISRDLGVLEGAGLIAIDPDKAAARPIVLTDEGHAQLAAIGRAQHGGQARRPRDRCLAEKIAPNPANRRVEAEAIAALADTIEAVGDVLESIQLTPADANGVRMLLDGEHRWRAVQLLAEQGRLPPALEKGLRFEEREATEAEQILIRIVTATARADLSPLDDARQLLALQKATGWSATEIAKKTGRSPVDSNTGVRDVQSKIRVAREASADALRQYELDGSWDRLRDSVTDKKPAPAPADPADRLPPSQELSAALAEYGAAAIAPSPSTEDDSEGDDGAGAKEAVDRDPDWLLDNPDWTSTDIETRNGAQNVRLRIFARIGDIPGWFVSISTSFADGGIGESYRVRPDNPIYSNRLEALQAARRRVIERHPLAPPWVRNWLDQQLGPHFVNGRDCLNASNAGEARRAAGLEARKANSGGGSAAHPSTPPASAPSAPSLDDRAGRMGDAARAGTDLVLAAAIAELTEAIDSHLAGIRRDMVQGGQDLAGFEEDTEHLREAMARAGDAIEALGLGEGEGLPPTEERAKPRGLGEPFVPIRKSITPEHVTCLYDGRRFAGGLRRHLLTRYGETPDEYRRKWNLPADYPMVAPNHAKRQHDALRAAALRSAGK